MPDDDRPDNRTHPNDDLSRLFPRPSADSIDTDAVLRRARRRRLPRQVAIGGVAAVAVVGIVIGGGSLLGSASTSFSMGSASGGSADSAAEPESAADAPGTTGADGGDVAMGDAAGSGGAADGGTTDGIRLAPVEKLNACAAPLAEVAPAQSGLVLTTDFPATIDPGTGSVEGTVTLTNTGTRTVEGSTAATPAITLSQNGETVWHSNGPTIAMAAVVDLAPGESMTFTASLVPVVCGDEDETRESFRDDLPAAAAGTYDVSAAIQFSPADPEASGLPIETVTGPLQSVTIR